MRIPVVLIVVLFTFFSRAACSSAHIEKPLSFKQAQQVKLDTKKEIVFGQSGFFSGHFRLYGDQIRVGILSYFKRINERGGIKKKQLRLLSIKDKGKPDRTRRNTLFMKNKLGISMFLGSMGTNSTLGLLSEISHGDFAYLFPWAGNPELRAENLKYIINGLGNIGPQIETIIDHVVNKLNYKKISLFHADSSFGLRNGKLAIQALTKHMVRPIGVATYNRFTMDMKKPTEILTQDDPRIIVCLSSSTPVARLVNEFLQKGHYGTEFIGIDSTLFSSDMLEEKGVTVPYASVIPNPENCPYKIAKDYLADLDKYYPKQTPNVLSFAYYIHAAIVCTALHRITGPITKEAVIHEIEKMRATTIGGFAIDFEPLTRHVYPQKVEIIKD